MANNPFVGTWAVELYELRNVRGVDVGLPFGRKALFRIRSERGSLLTVEVSEQAPGSSQPRIFSGSWQGGDVPSLAARWVDTAGGSIYQLVASPKDAGKLDGGYFRAALPGLPSLPRADSDGAGSWVGTGPIFPENGETPPAR